MFHPLALFVGLRYLHAKRHNHYISFISLISTLGIAVGVAALIIVLSVMNGFGNELRSRLLSLSAHVTINHGGIATLAGWRELAERVSGDPQVVRADPYVRGEGMLVNGIQLGGVQVDGIVPDRVADNFARSVLDGSIAALESGAHRMVIGSGLAQRLGLLVGDSVNLLVPRSKNGALTPLLRRFEVAGIFELGIAEHDSIRALVHIDDAALIYGLTGDASGVSIDITDIFRAPAVAHQFAEMLGPEYEVENWANEQQSYFRAIRIEKTMMFVILLLIVAVAAFNIVATLVMVVNEKRSDIAILRTIGMTPNSVMGVFMVQGTFIGLIGILLGLAIGVGVATNIETMVPQLEGLLGRKLIPADLYYITEVPSDLRWPEVGIVATAAFLLAALSTVYPARRAARTHPAEALRYE